MQKTMTEMLAWVDEVVPNRIPTTSKLRYIAENLGDSEFTKFNSAKTWYDTQTVANQSDYNLPAGVRITDIIYVGISNTTYNSTDIVGSSTPFNEHKYTGLRDDSYPSYTDYTTKLTLKPAPDDAYHMRVIYTPQYRDLGAASSDSTTIIEADTPLMNWLQCKVAARVCKSMAFPRIDLGNNYEIDAETYLGNARLNWYKRKRRESKVNIGWRDWWC
jgi:hypothetical protein